MIRNIPFRAALASLLFAALVPFNQAAAQNEKITRFKSVIAINPDGTMRVNEQIEVVSAGKRIKQGIYRDFPTEYKDRYGNTVRVEFRVEDVRRDGETEGYHLGSLSNGERVYMGRKGYFLEPGTHSYSLTYTTDRQIGFFKDFDELYWNVTGNGWDFTIEKAEAVIMLPPGARALNTAAYTGPQGARGQDFETGHDSEGNIVFRTTRALMPGEGLTIAVSWPKGIVAEPSAREKMSYLLRDNPGVLPGIAGLVILVAFYFLAWSKVGKDPARGTVIPLFEPPAGITPGSARFIMHMGFDNKTFASALVNMAVKGFLKIREDEDSHEFTLVRTGKGEESLSPAEKRAAEALFRGSWAGLGPVMRGIAAKFAGKVQEPVEEIELKSENHTRISSAVEAMKSSLKRDYEKVYFLTNTSYFAIGLAISLLTLAGVVISSAEFAPAVFLALWLSGWTFGTCLIAAKAVDDWKSGTVKSALRNTFIALVFIGFEIGALVAFTSLSSLAATLVLVCLGIVNALFHYLLKAPTMTGRRVMDRIEGFKLYLSVAEKHRLAKLNPPEKTPELFEKYLPYALALDVEQAWSEQFADILAKAGEEGQTYTPGWYVGRSWDRLGTMGLAESVGSSLAGAVSSSSTAPGSVSGSGGGGFSGGGGGGGGGGGW